MKRELTLRCPCCEAELVIDVTRGRVVHHRVAPAPGDKASLEELAQRAKEKPALQDKLFGSALLGERDRHDSLEDSFRRAREEAQTRGDFHLEAPDLPAAESASNDERTR